MNSSRQRLNPRTTQRSGFVLPAFLAAVASLSACPVADAQGPQSVLQRGYDAGVTGAILTETTLSTSNVSPQSFGLVFKLPVDDAIFAEPLYVPNVAIPGQGTHNVVYVATMSDTLYAFDADNGGLPLWKVNFAAGSMPIPMARFVLGGDRNIVGNLGILSTPVIDPATNILYLVAGTVENNTMAYRLHAVDIKSGAEPFGPGVLLAGSSGGAAFDARYLFQRPSLVLSGNQVVIAFSALQNEAAGNYSGWVLAYNKSSLQQSGALAIVPTGNLGGGIWMSGRPPAVDSSGYVYLFTGNGWGGGYDGVQNFSETALKLDPSNGLAIVDWFTPGNWSDLDTNDLDLSASGPLLLPGTSLLTGGSKAGELYLVDTTNMGKFNANDSQIVQEMNIANNNEILSGPVYWARSSANGGSLLYNWGKLDTLKAYSFANGQFGTSPVMQGGGAQQFPGGVLTLSANGEQPASGVLWATVVTSGDAEENPPAPGALHAYNASNLSQELWNSTMNPSRDGFGNFAKFVPPMVVNGRVYVATWSNQVAVYGLLNSYTVSPGTVSFPNVPTNQSSTPIAVTVTNTGATALPITGITLSTPSPHPFSQTSTCGASLAAGATCTINLVFSPVLGGTSTATLSINAGGGAGTKSVSLSGTGVLPPSFQTLLTPSASSVSLGAPVTLTWSSTTGAVCAASGGTPSDGWTGTLPASGNMSVTEATAGTYTYGLTCTTAQNASSFASASVTVTAATIPTVTLSASPTSVTIGQSVTLTWSSKNAAACTAGGGQSGDGWSGNEATSGSLSVMPQTAGTIKYLLTCTAGTQSANASAQVSASSAALQSSTPRSSSGGGAFDPLSLFSLASLTALRVVRRRRSATDSPAED